jgi:Flp pilus assembly pilin Flp
MAAEPAMTARRTLRRLHRDDAGAAMVEFALVAPVFILLVIGTIEVAIVIFMSSSIESAVLQASRFGITGGLPVGVSREERVLEIVGDKTYGLVDMDTVDVETLVYDSFADIGEPEPFEDDNGNDSYDAGEVFTDVNGNGQWDPDMGEAGLGGPSDVVVYRVTYDWGIITPVMRDILGESVRHVSSIAVRNEPF